MIKIGINKDLHSVVEALNQFLFQNSKENKKHEIYLVRKKFLLPLNDIIKNPVMYIREILRNRSMPKTIKLPLKCKKIRVKSNIRILGYGENGDRSVKIALKSPFLNNNLRREIRVRRLLFKYSDLNSYIPKVFTSDPKGNWIIEEYIQEVNYSKDDKAYDYINYFALPFYQKTCQLKSIKLFYKKEIQEQILLKLANRLKYNKNLSFNLKWPVSLCHGDLNYSNIIHSKDEKLYIIDWENAQVLPVAYEMLLFILDISRARNDTLEVLNDLSGSSKQVLQPKLQLSIIMTREIIVIEKLKADLIQYLVKENVVNIPGLSMELTIESLDRQILKYNELIIDLLT